MGDCADKYVRSRNIITIRIRPCQARLQHELGTAKTRVSIRKRGSLKCFSALIGGFNSFYWVAWSRVPGRGCHGVAVVTGGRSGNLEWRSVRGFSRLDSRWQNEVFILRHAIQTSYAKIVKPGLRIWRSLRAYFQMSLIDFFAESWNLAATGQGGIHPTCSHPARFGLKSILSLWMSRCQSPRSPWRHRSLPRRH